METSAVLINVIFGCSLYNETVRWLAGSSAAHGSSGSMHDMTKQSEEPLGQDRSRG